MQTPTNRTYQRHGSWCALVVLLAVCSLTINVTTRYCSTESALASASGLHKYSSPEASRQRLTKDAATWIPPVVRALVLPASSFSLQVAPASPPLPALLLEISLHNRPPPSSAFLA